MAKVLCEGCGTSFLYSVVKDMKVCPVCGKSLWEDSAEDTGNVENVDAVTDEGKAEDGLMYFDDIMTFEDEPEYNHVCVYCGECGKDNSLEIDKFDKLVDQKYVILKKNYMLQCRGCGKEHKPRKILYKKKEHYAPPLPRCPVCNSEMLKKIKTSSKILAAATLGTFALPYNSKTFECQNCNYKF